MPRFHFDFRDGSTLVRDVEGAEFATVELAYEEAFRAAQEMWRDRLRRREDPQRCAFEITDGDGRLLTVVPFVEVLESCHVAFHRKPPHVDAVITMHRTQRLRGELMSTLNAMREAIERSRALVAGAKRT